MNRTISNQGFTLVEVLVALTIFSGLMLTLFSSFDAFSASTQMIRHYEERNRDIGPGLDTMISDLEQIFVLQPPQFLKQDVDESDDQKPFRFLAETDHTGGESFPRLVFASLSPAQFHRPVHIQSGITRLTYYVHAGEDRLDLHRSDMPVILYDEDKAPPPCADPVLFKDIKEFELMFFDREGNEYEAWDSRDEKYAHAFPAQVGITVTLGKSGKGRKISTLVSLPVQRTVEK